MNTRQTAQFVGLDLVNYLIYANGVSLALMVFLHAMSSSFPLVAWHLPLFVGGTVGAFLAKLAGFAALRLYDEAERAAGRSTSQAQVITRQSNRATMAGTALVVLSLAMFAAGWILIGQPF
jgi:hypothetical protein